MKPASYLSRLLFSWIIFFLIWLLFTSTLDIQEMSIGLVISLIIALMGGTAFSAQGVRLFSPRRIYFAIRFLLVFFFELLKANLDVARRVISPGLNINPGIVAIPTQLKTPLGRMILANAITLTPGTLTIEVRDDRMFIHWIDVKSSDPETAYREIAASFEPLLKEFVEP